MSSRLSRRGLLFAAPALALAFSVKARAAEPGAGENRPRSRVVRIEQDERGVTALLELEAAPFPAPTSWHKDKAVLVYVPAHYRMGREPGVAMIVHFHGHNTTAERAILAHQLREQLFDSKQNAILVVPQLAFMAADSSAGKLEQPGGFARLLEDVLRTMEGKELRAALGASAPKLGAEPSRVCVSAHSGGYHAAASALRQGGIPVRETYLFDALYAGTDVFRDWVIAGKGNAMSSRHKLVSYFTGGTTEANTRALFAELARAGVVCAEEKVEGTLSRTELTHAEAVAIKTQLGHGTVTSELNSLRDCLYASALRRRLRSSWFDAREGQRPLERRRR